MKLKFLFVLLMLAVATVNAQTSANENAARQWIKAHASELKIKNADAFQLSFVRKSLSGETLRFQQLLNDVPVFGSEIVIHFSKANKITSSTNSYDPQVISIATVPQISKETAIQKSNAALKIEGTISHQDCKLFVYNKLPQTKLVYRVVTDSELRKGSWETLVDAMTGEIISTKDVAIYFHGKDGDHGDEKKSESRIAAQAFVVATGMVYNPDPLSVAHVAYSGNYRDLNDAANTQLNAARSTVQIPEVELNAGVYKLKGSYVEIKELGAPAKGLFTQATNDFSFDRNNDAFEAVNAYYHLDKSLRYVNETLGIVCRPLNHGGILWYDPSSVDGDDNSFYSNGSLNFGEGGVDDAEDADVVLHELGHGIHDWITGGNLSQTDGLSEGCGDYWAQSYSRSLNQWAQNEAAYHYVFSWDGHNQYWPGRSTNVNRTYPGDLVGQIHTDGEIWSTSLMKIYNQIGRTKMDLAFLEGLAMTGSSTGQEEAAVAVRQAAIDMNYTCDEVSKMTEIFTNTGYFMPPFEVTIGCPDEQVVYVAPGTNYTVASFISLSNAISENCDAVVTQVPAIGSSLPAGTYEMTMTANGSVSCNFTLRVEEQLATGEHERNNFALYPNPASSSLTVKGNFDSAESVTIYNLLGQKLLSKKISSGEETIDVSSLSNGVYSIYFNTAKIAMKFVKQ